MSLPLTTKPTVYLLNAPKSFNINKPFQLISRLEYWFSRPRFKEGFFKFLEPCPHRLYRKGDSWAEEVGWKRDLFKRVFDEIGTRYISKTAYVKAREMGTVFQGKPYAAYYDRKTNRTFFIRNHGVAQSLLESLKQPYNHKKPNGVEEPLKEEDARVQEFSKITKNDKILSFQPIREHNNTLHTPHLTQYSSATKTQSPIYNTKLTYKDISSLKEGSDVSQNNAPHKKPVREEDILKMIKIWEETICPLEGWQKMGAHLTRLKQAFVKLFEASLENWQVYCRKIASSKFLMGEGGSSFKAWITWAIKEETIARITQGGFTLGDRSLPEDEVLKAQKDQNRRHLNHLFETMSEGDKQAYLPLYVQDLSGKNPAMAHVIKRSGLCDHFHHLSFKHFVLEQLKGQGRALSIA
jgi:hypothetical protein